MKPTAALRLPVAENLAGFVKLLRRLQVPHRVTEEGPEQVLWVPTLQLAEQVRALHQRYPEGDNTPGMAPAALPAPRQPSGLWRQLRASPVTAVVFAGVPAGRRYQPAGGQPGAAALADLRGFPPRRRLRLVPALVADSGGRAMVAPGHADVHPFRGPAPGDERALVLGAGPPDRMAPVRWALARSPMGRTWAGY